MKKTVLFLLAVMLFISCKQSITNADIVKINGYWEINSVNLPDGSKKDYKVNETVDYFNVKDNKGFRQKVMPQLDGTYLTNNIKENISISQEDGEYYVYYITNYGKWREKIVEIKDSSLVLKNEANLEYHYKRQIPFSIK